MKKNVGTRMKPAVYSPEEQRVRRAKQAARAILSPRLYPLTDARRAANWERIARCFADLSDASAATSFAHRLGLARVPAHLLDAAFPPKPEPEPEPAPTADALYAEAASDACAEQAA